MKKKKIVFLQKTFHGVNHLLSLCFSFYQHTLVNIAFGMGYAIQ